MKALLLLLPLLLATPARAADVSGLDWAQHPGAPVPTEAPLREADGRATTLGAVAAGRPLLLLPGYFNCPNLCGTVREDLLAALSVQPDAADLPVVLLTVDPAETPADALRTLRAIRERYPVLPVHALTGPPASLLAITDAIGFPSRPNPAPAAAPAGPAPREFIHPAGLAVLSPAGRVSGYLLGVGTEPGALRAAIRLAQEGGAAAAEPVHLFCFSYDPVSGRFSLAAMEALRAAALLTAAGVALSLYRLHRRP